MTAATTSQPGTLAAKVGRASVVMLLRRFAVSALTACTSIVIARVLLPASFGEYSAALATYFLLLGLADFGIAQELARRLGIGHGFHDGSVAVAVRLQVAWSTGVALLGGGLALLAGITTPQGMVLAILCPSIATSGVSVLRQVFYARQRIAPLATLDIAMAVVQTGATLAVAAWAPTTWAFAAILSAGSVIGNVAVWVMARGTSAAPAAAWRPFARAALPIGIASFLASAYGTIDLVLLPYLVTSEQVGQYAAAVKFVSILAQIPVVIAAISLSSIASTLGDPPATSRLVAATWSWYVTTVVAAACWIALFSPLIAPLAFGQAYADAAGPLSVLMLAVVGMAVANVLGGLLVAHRLGRRMVTQSVVALLLNVSGNLVLVPRYGIAAAAWLTVVAEVTVCALGYWALRHAFDVRPSLAVSLRPLVALAVLPIAALTLGRHSGLAAAVALAGYVLVLALVRGMPHELTPAPLRRYLCT